MVVNKVPSRYYWIPHMDLQDGGFVPGGQWVQNIFWLARTFRTIFLLLANSSVYRLYSLCLFFFFFFLLLTLYIYIYTIKGRYITYRRFENSPPTANTI